MTFLHNAGLTVHFLSVVLVKILIYISKISEICNVVFSAGLGVLNMAVQAVNRMAGLNGIPSKHQFYLIDKDVSYLFLALARCKIITAYIVCNRLCTLS